MDIDETLRQLRGLLGGDHSGYFANRGDTAIRHETKPAKSLEDLHTMVCEAEELWQALNGWLTRKGHLPRAWERCEDQESSS